MRGSLGALFVPIIGEFAMKTSMCQITFAKAIGQSLRADVGLWLVIVSPLLDSVVFHDQSASTSFTHFVELNSN